MERRRDPRFPIKLPLYYRIDKEGGSEGRKHGRFWTKDVSIGGLRFETREGLEQGTHLIIELNLPKKTFSDFLSQDPMHIKVRVAWVGVNHGKPKSFEVGTEFVELLERKQKRIEECIQFFMREEEWDH